MCAVNLSPGASSGTSSGARPAGADASLAQSTRFITFAIVSGWLMQNALYFRGQEFLLESLLTLVGGKVVYAAAPYAVK